MTLEAELLNINSSVLKGNPLGDPVERKILVFHPDRLIKDAPLLIELAGLNGTPKLNNRFSQVLKKLYSKNMLENSVIINPDFSTKYHVNQYINSPGAGNYEDFIIKEIIPYISEKYKTGNVGLFGKSSGGFGAYTIASNHPDIISGFADHFGDSGFEYVYIPDIPVAYGELHGTSVHDYLEEKSRKQDLTDEEIRTLNIIGMSAFYSYDTENGTPELPFDTDTGMFREDIWKKWSGYDPVRNIDSRIENLKKLKAIYMDVGTKDEYSLFMGMRTLHDKMETLGIKHSYQEFNGGHFYNTPRYEESLPYLAKKLSE
ncbi:MAG: alpha/beta hydrolase-fold protein [Ferroplasma sp.]|uniref:alpha/beta hydrolase-fold protein n=1 Tax=Ferroplasma sp. TaxID=2591003 RepID=UPI0028150272|nr:alpha/beta hydrolase-fold protein [Ferroplasma sp.]WMT51339.1 MAG: alpha/beta hydrolase-fold protein [Ferroplasma sp.]